MKTMKKILSAALALTLCAGVMAGCGEQSASNGGNGGTASGGSGQNAAPAPEFVYTSEYIPVKSSDVFGLGLKSYAGDKFYAIGTYIDGKVSREITDPDTGETQQVEYDNYTSGLYRLGLDGSLEQLPYTAPKPEPEEGKEIYAYLTDFTVAEDGTMYILEETDVNWNDAPEGTDPNSEEYGNYYHYSQDFTLRILSPAGEEIRAVDLAELTENRGEDEYFSMTGMALDKEGNLYLGSGERIFVLDRDGTLKTTVESENWLQKLLALGDGVYCGYYGEKGQVLAKLDPEKGAFGDELPVRGDLYSMTAGGGDYDLYFTNGINFYGYKLADGSQEKVLNWISSDVDPDRNGAPIVLPDGRVVSVFTEYRAAETVDGSARPEYDVELVVLTKKPADQVPQRETLTLATQYLDYTVRSAVIDFNKNSDKYRIEVQDYSEYNTEDDYSAGLTKLQAEVLSGVVPDILDLNGLPVERFIAKGYLEDLYPWLDGDGELSRESLLPSVLKAMESGGKLYRTCDGFSVQTVIGAPRVVGDKPGWTLAQYKAALAQMPEGCQPFDQWVTRDSMLSTMLELEGDSFVDRATGECRFDSPEFAELLEFVNTFPVDSPAMDEDYEWSEEDEPPARIARGEQMLYATSLSYFEDLAQIEAMFGGEMTFIGYPVASGAGNSFSLRNGYAMSSACANKDAAWAFLRQFFTERYQKDSVWALPTNAAVFEKKLKDAMTPQYQTDANGEFVLNSNGERIEIDYGSWRWGGVEVKYHPMTEAEAAQIRELIETTTRTSSYDEDIYDIVTEGAAPFFAGQRSAQEVAKQIQSKAMLYINEQR